MFLKRLIHCEIGQVATIAEISQSAAYSNEFAFVPSGENQVCIGKHTLNPRQIVGGAANAGRIKNRSYISSDKGKIMTVFNL